ncbi:iron chelate uptake ABC transporter family permease subunit [Candidatus Bathyarchaeota archaeon]|nr:iron chelate uptake ABC transporter family permease subunit [Candidatus Bathyarchaeota archaeon]
MASENVESRYFKRASRWKLIILVLVLVMIVTSILSLGIGFAKIPFSNIFQIIAKRIPFLNNLVDTSLVIPSEESIILQIRVPRILAGILVGAALAAAGVIYQGIFKNPMADSYVLGVSAGASVGASLVILFGVSFTLLAISTVQIAAFICAVLTVFLVYSISKVGGRVPITTLLLSGIAVTIFLSAIVTIIQVMAGERLQIIVFWLMGGFYNIYMSDIWAIFPFIIFGIFASYFFVRDLNILALGEETAQHLGVDTAKVTKWLLIISSMVAAAAVSISGLIGFVGLMIPHMTRLIIGPDHRILLPASAITGAIFLVACDAVARVVLAPVELPVGVITALCGGPFFIYLLRKKKSKYSL